MSKEVGDIGEISFLLKAKKIGFCVLTPYSSISKYDFVIDNFKELIKIQVKSTSKLDSRSRYKVALSHGRNCKSSYSANQVDYFAIYIQPEDLFYIIPHSAVKTKTLILYPYKKDHVLNNYLERWDLLK